MKYLSILTLIIFGSLSYAATEHTNDNKYSKNFNKMKSLQGNWKGIINSADKKMTIKVNYKISSAGSSLVETYFVGEPHEMVTVYTDDKGKVNMTHYCSMKNQPSMKLQKSDKDTFKFNYVSGTNMDVSKDAHMHNLVLKFINKNTIEQQWTQFKDGEIAGTNTFKLSRVN